VTARDSFKVDTPIMARPPGGRRLARPRRECRRPPYIGFEQEVGVRRGHVIDGRQLLGDELGDLAHGRRFDDDAQVVSSGNQVH
jgi:hypothetical protein